MSVLRALAGVAPCIAVCIATWWVVATETGSWRQSLALSTVAIGVLVGVGTELLSLVHAVNMAGILVLYAVYGAALFAWWRRLVRSGHRAPERPWRTLRNAWVAMSGTIIGALLVLAVVAPPNNWDSMTYHMSRVAHWTAQGDVTHYATHIDRQLFLQPLAEYAILHTYVLSNSDVWANLVQWAAMVVTLVSVTLVARNLGLSRRAQLAAAIVALTLPMGITQSTTTQNDFAAAMWIVVLAVLVTDAGRLAAGTNGALLVGTVAGLAAMTKATSYFFLAPLLLWWLLRKVELKPAAVGKAALVVGLPALLLSGPGFLRNIETFSRPLGPPLAEFVNDPIGPQAAGENMVRHFALQFGVPSDAVNLKVTQGAREVASVVGLDLDRTGSTFPAGHRFVVSFGYREDDAQAFAATTLLIVAVPLLVLTQRRRRFPDSRSLASLFVCAAAGAVLLETYFRWNPWNGRYLMPFFIITAVVSAAALERVPRTLRGAVLTALVGSSLLWVLGSDLRPVARKDSVLIASRDEQYFAARPELRAPYLEATAYVRSMQPERVGFVGNGDDWEYPLWVLLNKDRDQGNVVLESVQVANPSRRYEHQLPDVVICTRACSRPSEAASWSMRRFGLVSVWAKP